MSKTRVALLSALVLLTASGTFASPGSAFGPYWHVNGAKLAQGTKQLKLQLKGVYIQKTMIAGIPVTTECHGSRAEGAAIEGSGTNQGQDKGRLVFTQCTINLAHCKIAEPITTRQGKSHLVTYKGAQSKYADLFEPQQGEIFSTYFITDVEGEKCPVAGEYQVRGTVAAEVLPKESESQEILIAFPETPISVVSDGIQERRVGLSLGPVEFKVAGFYGARLDNGEKFGVFGQ